MDTLEEVKLILKELAISQAKNEKEIKELRKSQTETDKQIKQTSLEVDRVTKQVENLKISFTGFTNNQGSMIENIFFNSIEKNMNLDNIQYTESILNLNIKKKEINLNQEFDIVLKNGSHIALIETKSKPRLSDIKQLETIIENYKILFKEHKNYTIQGYLASLGKFNKNFKQQAQKKGLKLLNLSGDKGPNYLMFSFILGASPP